MTATTEVKDYALTALVDETGAFINADNPIPTSGGGGGGGSSGTGYQIYMLYNNIANIPAATNDVAGWNVYLGTDAVTAVTTSGNAVILTCSHQFMIQDDAFSANTSLLKLMGNAITSMGAGVLNSANAITDLVLPECTAVQYNSISCSNLRTLSLGGGKKVTLANNCLRTLNKLDNLSISIDYAPDYYLNEVAVNDSELEAVIDAKTSGDYVMYLGSAIKLTLTNMVSMGDNCLSTMYPANDIFCPELEIAGINFMAAVDANFTLHIPKLKTVGAGSFGSITAKTCKVYTNSHFNNTSTEFAAFKAANTVTVVLVDAPVSQTTTSGDLTSTATTSTAQSCDGADTVQLTIKLGTATTPPSIQIQGTDDGTNWYNLGLPLAGVASSTVTMSVPDVLPKQIRWKVSSAGASIGAGWSIILKAN